jgi:photosystem II stability/assembly factor-like uncharacterized protein
MLDRDGTGPALVPFPERVDLIAISALDEQRASVTTSDGRLFETTDAGRTWQRADPR